MFFSSILDSLIPSNVLSAVKATTSLINNFNKFNDAMQNNGGNGDITFISNSDINFAQDGAVVPIVYGTAIVRGQKIWSSDIRLTTIMPSVSDVLLNSTSTTKARRYIDIAYMICGGEIDDVLQVYHVTKPISIEGYDYVIYKGTEYQKADPTIKNAISKDLAFRGTAYIVFKNLDITNFGGNAPNLYFKVKRSKINYQKIYNPCPLIKGVNLIPGSGEFVLDTKIQSKQNGNFNGQTFVPKGIPTSINQNTGYGKSDLSVSLDGLKKELPNVKWVSSVVCWFCDGMNISNAEIYPAVEYSFSGISLPDDWSVAGITRQNARLVSRDEFDRPNYGGTIADVAVLRGLDELRLRGYKTMFYPMMMMDVAKKPWRGHLSGDAGEVYNFFNKTNGYNDFILHCANLVKGKVDAFIIGSEFIGLTKLKLNNIYPAVEEFKKLAKKVKNILGFEVKISYAADWSEYHHTDGGWYNLDPLWADENIDFIGIDQYFPLSDGLANPSVEDIIKGFTSGEGYDFYYKWERTQKYPLSKPYAWKDVRWFLENEHQNPDGTKTSWRPLSKKIWFVEYGFPSVDLCTNQPNVFYNPDAFDGGLPRFSQGYTDFKAQQDAIFASETFFSLNSDIIENAFLWAWDARPFPYFPKLLDVWSDGGLWRFGHWVNGKLNMSNLGDVIRDICLQAGFAHEEIDTNLLSQEVDGFILNRKMSFESVIKMLSLVYLFDCVYENSVLKFIPLNLLKQVVIDQSDIIVDDALINEYKDTQKTDTTRIVSLDLYFYNKDDDYNLGNVKIGIDSMQSSQTKQIQVPVAMNLAKAQELSTILLDALNGIQDYTYISLPINKYKDIKPLDVLIYNEKDIIKNLIVKKLETDGFTLKILGQNIDSSFFSLASNYQVARLKYQDQQISVPSQQSGKYTPILQDSIFENGFYIGVVKTDSNITNFDELSVFASKDGGILYNKICEVRQACQNFKIIDFYKSQNINPSLIDGVSYAVIECDKTPVTGLKFVLGGEIVEFYSMQKLDNYNGKSPAAECSFYKLSNFYRPHLQAIIASKMENKLNAITTNLGVETMFIDDSIQFVSKEIIAGQNLKIKLLTPSDTLVSVKAHPFTAE